MKISSLLYICALSLSAVAAYYSIVGLATIFSSAFWPVIIMASILEVSKLVVASWLYRKWKIVSIWIKTYLTIAVIILMMITSLGIFGFLSKAHVEQNLTNISANLEIEQINTQISSAREVISRYQSQLEQLDRSINLQLDANRASQADAARRRQAAERDQIRQRLDTEQSKITELTAHRSRIQRHVSVLEGEVGPIRYVAEFFVGSGNVDLEKSVRWMIVVLVLVFDPLAVLMLLAANMTHTKELEQIENSTNDDKIDKIVKSIENFKKLTELSISNIDRKLQENLVQSINLVESSNQSLNKLVVDSMQTLSTRSNAELNNLEKDIETINNQLSSINYENISKVVKDSMDEWISKIPSSLSTTQTHPDSNKNIINEVDAVTVDNSISTFDNSNVKSESNSTNVLPSPNGWL